MKEIEEAIHKQNIRFLKNMLDNNFDNIRPVINEIFWVAASKGKVNVLNLFFEYYEIDPFKTRNLPFDWNKVIYISDKVTHAIIINYMKPFRMSINIAAEIVASLHKTTNTSLRELTYLAVKKLTAEFDITECTDKGALNNLIGLTLRNKYHHQTELLIEWGLEITPNSISDWAYDGFGLNEATLNLIKSKKWPCPDLSIYSRELLSTILGNIHIYLPIINSVDKFESFECIIKLTKKPENKYKIIKYGALSFIKHPTGKFASDFYEKYEKAIDKVFQPTSVWVKLLLHHSEGKPLPTYILNILRENETDIKQFCIKYVINNSNEDIKTKHDIKAMLKSARKCPNEIHLFFLISILPNFSVEQIVPSLTKQNEINILINQGYDLFTLMTLTNKTRLKTHLLKKLC